MDEERAKKLDNFCEFIRSGINKGRIDLVAHDTDLQHRSFYRTDLNSIPEDQRYGVVDKEVFKIILDKYEKMQKDRETIESPVTCDNIAGKSFANHLHSRPGFHNTGSSKFLMAQLKIKEPNRYSLLGGISNLKPPKGDHIYELQRQSDKGRLESQINKIRQLLNIKRLDDAQSELNEAFKIETNNGRLHALQGYIDMERNKTDEAIKNIKRGLDKSELRDVERNEATFKLSEAYLMRGDHYLNRSKYDDAILDFREALNSNPNSDRAKYFLNLAEVKKRQSQPRPWGEQPFQTYRK